MLDELIDDECNLWVVFYTVRNKTGTPDQEWGDPDSPVYLTDHWEICWTKDNAITRHQKIFDEHDIHVSGIAPIDAEYSTDWRQI